MKSIIQISVLCIYFVISCFVIGENKWVHENSSADESFVETLFSVLTVSVSDYAGNSNELPIFFKDPTDDTSINLVYYHYVIPVEFAPRRNCFSSVEKIEDPFRYIFSPPPLNV